MALTLAFLPTPLLGPSVWAPVADCLAAQGYDTVICAPPAKVGTGPNVLDAFAAALPVAQDLVLSAQQRRHVRSSADDALLRQRTFLVFMAVFGRLFRTTVDRAIGVSMSFGTAPAMITAGVMGGSLRRRHGAN